MRRRLSRLLPALLLGVLLLLPARVWAGPVSWKEVPPTAEGRQWWDEGSLRRNRSGHLTVLSRFQAVPEPESVAEPSGAPAEVGAPSGGPVGNPEATIRAATLPSFGAARQDTGAGSRSPSSSPAPVGSLPPAVGQRPSATARSAPTISRLYVMELDCDQSLYRDISINGLPQFGALWQPTGSDDLTAEVLRQACAAEAA